MALGQGRHTALRPHLTAAEWEVLRLTQVVQSPLVDTALRTRARMVLLLAQGQTITAVASAVGLSRRHVYKWLHRWREQGLAGLRNRANPGRRGSSKWS